VSELRDKPKLDRAGRSPWWRDGARYSRVPSSLPTYAIDTL